MGEGALSRVLDAIAGQQDELLSQRVCTAAALLLEAAGVTIALNGVDHHQTVASTMQGVAGDQLQIDLGEGPGHDAYRDGEPVLAADLTSDGTWPAFSAAALEAGIRAAFSFPLRSGAVRIGSLNVYRDLAVALTPDQYRDGMVFAALARELLVSLQAEVGTSDLHDVFGETGRDTWEVHQASGMVSAQLGVSVTDAAALLRAHAYAEERPVSEVAADVVTRRLHLGGPERPPARP